MKPGLVPLHTKILGGLVVGAVTGGLANILWRVIDGIAGAVEVMIGIAMSIAPIGVAALIFVVTARFGFDLLASLGLYVAVVLGGLVVHQLGTQAIVLTLVVLTAVGASGVPSGSIPLLVLVLETVGVPGASIALVLGIDRILDMARTVLNVTGDLVTSIVVDRWQRREVGEEEPALEEVAVLR